MLENLVTLRSALQPRIEMVMLARETVDRFPLEINLANSNREQV